MVAEIIENTEFMSYRIDEAIAVLSEAMRYYETGATLSVEGSRRAEQSVQITLLLNVVIDRLEIIARGLGKNESDLLKLKLAHCDDSVADKLNGGLTAKNLQIVPNPFPEVYK